MVTLLLVWLCVHTALTLTGIVTLIVVEIRDKRKTDVLELVKATLHMAVFPALFWSVVGVLYYDAWERRKRQRRA